MDPNEALRTIKRLLDQYKAGKLNDIELDDLLSAVEALDGWLSKGGFLPDAWNKKQHRVGGV